MSSTVSDAQLGDAILRTVEHGAFPQDEDVASANVPSEALPKLLQVIETAREEARDEVRKVSREAASDVDGWIAQARRLQQDIKNSQETAKEIVRQAEENKQITARVHDAASKVSLLHTEIAYNETLTRTIQHLQDISALLDSAQEAAVSGHIVHALERLEDADSAFHQLGAFQATRAVALLRSKKDQLQKAIVETITDFWNGLVVIDNPNRKISLKDSIERETTVDINTVVEALIKLDILGKFVVRLSRDFDRIIVTPRLTLGQDKVVSTFEIDGDDIRSIGGVNDGSVKAALQDIHVIAEYLSTRLPASIAVPLSTKLVPTIASRLIHNLLLPAVPISTQNVHDFQETLSYVLGLVEYLDELKWVGQSRLTEWVDKAAEIWLARQKESAIARVQSIIPKRVLDRKVVERVETQLIVKGDALHSGKDEQEDDWGADWEDDDASNVHEKEDKQEVEEEDMSAWGEDDAFSEEPQATSEKKREPAEDEDTEDWGAEWDDEEGGKSAAPAAITKTPTKTSLPSKVNEKPVIQSTAADQRVTLRETYTVTAIPDAIIDIILHVFEDVETLNTPDLVTTAIAPASGGLYAIPSLLLAMYRATAAIHYSKDVAGNMLIYNDCQRLSDRLRALLVDVQSKDHSQQPRLAHASNRLKTQLEADIKRIDGFGKRAYGREMESQRQILRDHLEDAQGFQGCTNVPFATVCDDAIATTIDRISDVKRQWQNVLSNGAMLQSLGSLVSTALTKFINDVEDMSDIAEDESKKLHSYCVSLATLSQHFQDVQENGETRDMASIYTPNWFKFQYLSEILDSSLADIRYFWTDGELKLEMEGEEVVSLIEALFAPSDHRRRAIADIRRTSLR